MGPNVVSTATKVRVGRLHVPGHHLKLRPKYPASVHCTAAQTAPQILTVGQQLIQALFDQDGALLEGRQLARALEQEPELVPVCKRIRA